MRLKTYMLTLGIVLAGLFCAAITGLMLVQQMHAISVWSDFLQRYSHVFCMGRYAFLAILILIWPVFIRGLGRWRQWPLPTLQFLMRLRWRMAFFFLLFELLIAVPDLIDFFHHF